MRLENLAKVARNVAPIILGTALGIGVTLLFLFRAELILDGAVLIGAGVGAATFVIFVLLRVYFGQIRQSTLATTADDGPKTAHKLLKNLIPNLENSEAISQDLLEKGQSLVKNVATMWSATVALGIGIAAMGAIITMVTALATVRQVERIDTQNELITEQIFEAKASRIASVFSAQLPSLLTAIDEERGDRSDWQPSRALTARIQAVINISEPFSPDQEVVEVLDSLSKAVENNPKVFPPQDPKTKELRAALVPRLYSPQRGQLLQLLIASGLNFRSLVVPLDFSAADLRNVVLTPREDGPSPPLDLGQTILRNANLTDSILTNVDLSSTDLAGSILPNPQILNSAVLWKSPENSALSERDARWMQGPDVSYAVIVSRLPQHSIYFDNWEFEGTQARLFNNDASNTYLYWEQRLESDFSGGTAHLLGNQSKLTAPMIAAKDFVRGRVYDNCAIDHELVSYFKKLNGYSKNPEVPTVWSKIWELVSIAIGAEGRACVGNNNEPISEFPNPPKSLEEVIENFQAGGE